MVSTWSKSTGVARLNLLVSTRWRDRLSIFSSTDLRLRASARMRVSPGAWCMSMSTLTRAASSQISRAHAASVGSRVRPVDRAYMAPMLSVFTKTLVSLRVAGRRVFRAIITFIASNCEM